ncbi:hypothetical protein [Bdellovibrio bacteriovorus]|uniref:hypothetical protein n=1 Tax=Bdellovibrio bacteriovorus TaxID=959 RepID=UPI0035A97055
MAIAIEVTNKALNQALEYGIGEMEKKSQDEASKLLADKLNRVSAKDLREFNSLKDLNPDQALLRAEQMVNNWMSEKDLMSLPAPQRAEARSIISSWMARTAIAKLAENQSANDIIQKNISADLDSTTKELFALGKSLNTFAKETRSNLQKIVETQEGISKELNQISGDLSKQTQKIEKVADDVDFLKNFAFSRMSAREQLSYLKNQIPPETGKKEWDKRISLLERKIEFEEGYKEYFNGAQNLVTIGKNLGVNGATLQSIQDGLEKLDRLKSGVESIMQNNYLAGIASLSGLFGGGGESAEAARHRAIIARLDRVIENQKLISEQIQVSFKIQVEMLNTLSNQLRQSTEVLYLKMDKVHNDVLGNRVLLANIVHRGLKSCEFVSDQIRDKGLQKAFFAPSNFKRHLSECSLEYDNLFGRKDFATYFALGVYKEARSKEVFEAEESIYADSLTYISGKFKDNYSLNSSLGNPSENAYGLIQKNNALKADLSKRISYGELSEETENLRTRFFSPGVIKNVQRMIAIFPAINIWNARTADNFSTPSDFLNLKEEAGKDDIALLDSALKLVNLSIQQENVLAGDMILPLMYEDFAEIQNEDNKCLGSVQVHARCLLQQNKLLFRNFLVFSLYKEFHDQRFSVATYRQQLRIPGDIKGLKALLKNNWNISWNAEKGIYEAKVAGQPFPMPSYDEVVEAKLSITEVLPSLLRAREDLIHLKTEMRINSTLKSDEKATIHRLFIR